MAPLAPKAAVSISIARLISYAHDKIHFKVPIQPPPLPSDGITASNRIRLSSCSSP